MAGTTRGDPQASRSPAPGKKSTSLLASLLQFIPAYLAAIIGYLLVNVVSARVLGVGAFGYFVVLVTVTNLIGQQAILGVHRSGLREAARAADAGTLGQLRNGVLAIMLVPLPLVSVVTGAVVWALRDEQPGRWAVAIASAVLVYCSGYQSVNTNFLRGLGMVRYANMLAGRSGGAVVAVAQALCVLLVGWLRPEWGLGGVLGAAAFGYVVVLLWASLLLRRAWDGAKAPFRVRADLTTVLRRDWRFAMVQAGSYLNSTVELWLSGLILVGTLTSLLAAAQRFAQLLLIPTTSLNIVFSPAISRLAPNKDRTELQWVVRTGATMATLISGLAWLPMVLAPGLLLSIVYGKDFVEAAPALALLSTATLLNALTGPAMVTLSMSGREGVSAILTWISFITRLISGAICAHFFGLMGLAASATVITALNQVASWTAVRRIVGISTHVTLRPRLSLLRRTAG